MLKFLVVEDNDLQQHAVTAVLTYSFPDCEIKIIQYEGEFVQKLHSGEISSFSPSLVIMDIMLKANKAGWPEAACEAGIRCRNRLRKDPRTASIPVIYYSLLDKSDIPGITFDKTTHWLAKDGTIDPLPDKIRDVLQTTAV